ncbi:MULTISPECIES: hypothetical protein [Flavobacteriaceae]|uniref:hypothetical protein n=1 Tax=Flavobacteriaceae TaxID=49546 RepID=UPI001492A372|nr:MULTISPECIES: hypothetical protein [Allomuricauda]MDC6366927.1 hypothetical protein [Muricauda sp. AC10]
MSSKNERPLTTSLLKLLKSKGQLRIDAADVVKKHPDGSVTVKMSNDEILAMRLLEYTNSKDQKQAKEAAKLVASYVLAYPNRKVKVTSSNNAI